MIFIFVVYSNAVDEEMLELVKKYTSGYSKFKDVEGEGHRDPHLGSHVWPVINNCIMTTLDKSKEKEFYDEIKKLKEKFPGVGIHTMAMNLKKEI